MYEVSLLVCSNLSKIRSIFISAIQPLSKNIQPISLWSLFVRFSSTCQLKSVFVVEQLQTLYFVLSYQIVDDTSAK